MQWRRLKKQNPVKNDRIMVHISRLNLFYYKASQMPTVLKVPIPVTVNNLESLQGPKPYLGSQLKNCVTR